MSWTTVGITFHCDACGAQSEIKPAPMRSYFDEQVPPDWTSLRALSFRVDLKDFFGSPVNHLCPGCAGIPFSGLVEKIARRVQDQQAATSPAVAWQSEARP